MPALRRLLAQRRLTVLLLAATLLLKLLVPTGYMIATDHGRVAITPCSGLAAEAQTQAMPGMHGAMPGHGKTDHGKTELPCAFAGLTAQALGAVDPVLLVAAVVFIFATGRLTLVAAAPRSRPFLRPPLRGPPAYR